MQALRFPRQSAVLRHSVQNRLPTSTFAFSSERDFSSVPLCGPCLSVSLWVNCIYTGGHVTERIASLRAPFLPSGRLSPLQLEQVSSHLDLLLQWNARMNLTSPRDPSQIVTRHFGESLFLAQTLFPRVAHVMRSPPPSTSVSALDSPASRSRSSKRVASGNHGSSPLQ